MSKVLFSSAHPDFAAKVGQKLWRNAGLQTCRIADLLVCRGAGFPAYFFARVPEEFPSPLLRDGISKKIEPWGQVWIPLGRMAMLRDHESLPIQEAREGSREAWDRLFQRYEMPLYVYVFELVWDHQETLDIVQETFIRAARYLSQLREDHKFGSWLFGIAHQQCLRQWRSAKHWLEPLPEDKGSAPLKSEVDDPSEILIRKEEEALLHELIESLPPNHRSVVLLHWLEGFSQEEISQITEVPLGTVKSRLYHARNNLRQKLERHL